jgi:hypothetical protein
MWAPTEWRRGSIPLRTVLNNSFSRTDGDGFHELEDLRARF